jgi:hypothetical protein
MRGRLFDGIAKACTLDKDHRMARLASPDRERRNTMFRPFLQGNMPGQTLQPALVFCMHMKLWRMHTLLLTILEDSLLSALVYSYLKDKRTGQRFLIYE